MLRRFFLAACTVLFIALSGVLLNRLSVTEAAKKRAHTDAASGATVTGAAALTSGEAASAVDTVSGATIEPIE